MLITMFPLSLKINFYIKSFVYILLSLNILNMEICCLQAYSTIVKMFDGLMDSFQLKEILSFLPGCRNDFLKFNFNSFIRNVLILVTTL